MAEKTNINFNIGKYPFRMAVDDADAIVYKKSAEAVQGIYNNFQARYPGKSVEELWVLTALQAASSYYKVVLPLGEKVEGLAGEVSRVLDEK